MISAIIEIVLLLSVSCLIGIYFTYRYWKEKYQKLEEQIRQLNSELEKAHQDAHIAKDERIKLEADLKESIQEAKTLQKELEKASSKNEQLEKSLKKANENAEILEEEVQKLEKKIKKQSSTPDDKKRIKKLKGEVDLLEEQMEEKEREIEVLSKELEKKKISYYKQIDGKRYKAITLTMADKAVAGKGDGRISKEDAQEIFDTISDGKAYTQVEKDTMRFLRENYKWTDSADELFRKKVRSWAAKGHELN